MKRANKSNQRAADRLHRSVAQRKSQQDRVGKGADRESEQARNRPGEERRQW